MDETLVLLMQVNLWVHYVDELRGHDQVKVYFDITVLDLKLIYLQMWLGLRSIPTTLPTGNMYSRKDNYTTITEKKDSMVVKKEIVLSMKFIVLVYDKTSILHIITSNCEWMRKH